MADDEGGEDFMAPDMDPLEDLGAINDINDADVGGFDGVNDGFGGGRAEGPGFQIMPTPSFDGAPIVGAALVGATRRVFNVSFILTID